MINEATEPSSACWLWRICPAETSTPPCRQQYHRPDLAARQGDELSGWVSQKARRVNSGAADVLQRQDRIARFRAELHEFFLSQEALVVHDRDLPEGGGTPVIVESLREILVAPPHKLVESQITLMRAFRC